MRALLSAHPATPTDVVTALDVEVRLAGPRLRLSFRLAADRSRVAIPAPAEAARVDGLWRHTCFEAFVRPGGSEAYVELNFSPSGEWAAYRFDAYRSGMAALDLAAPPRIRVRSESGVLTLDAEAAPGDAWLRAAPRLALSAVIEGADGRLSYWALAHPPGRPDFHHPSGFVLALSET